MDQQIAALRVALAATEASIASTQAALNNAIVPQDIAALRSMLVDLKNERTRLQFQLANLEAAAVEVAPAAAPAVGARAAMPLGAAPARRSAASRAKTKAAARELKATLADRTVAEATLKLAEQVLASARKLRDEPDFLGAGTSGPKGASKKR